MILHKYQMIVGSTQWAITLGRYDNQFAVNRMARFGCAPRDGYMKGMMIGIFGYLKYHTKGKLKFNLKPPNLTGLTFNNYNWHEQYPVAQEEIPTDAPELFPLLDKVYVTCYMDADHVHCLATQRSVTGIMIFINKTPIKWYSKQQNTTESSNYGSEQEWLLK
jgi:hypothetical protein